MKKNVRVLGLTMLVAALAGCGTTTAELDREHEKALNDAVGIEVNTTDQGVQVKLPESALFDFGKSDLRTDAVAVLERSVALLQRSDKPIEVDGYTDNVGTREYNQALSEARANTVAKALIARGVDSTRVTARGFAFDHPVADNSTEEGRALNRRTEVMVTGEALETLMGPAP
ncbi:OmpA family protein [Burkholderia cepacia]|uniref:OmpA family protein n=1 Tax=Burkholderia cepacia TaxID=292 RepID=A0A2S8I9Q8_BURCE|nr:OmpA family protein [Burkholderia cepacia]PQP11419.1 OmpA family protein [Burkholderia cepacia]HDR9511008.1 OmpA family protein [Burkholderia cepacia]